MNAHEVVITPAQLFRGILKGRGPKHIDFTQPWHECPRLEKVHSAAGEKSGLHELWFTSIRRVTSAQEYGFPSTNEWDAGRVLSN